MPPLSSGLIIEESDQEFLGYGASVFSMKLEAGSFPANGPE